MQTTVKEIMTTRALWVRKDTSFKEITGHLMRRRHGGRRARVRGQVKVAADLALLAAAINLARLAALSVTGQGQSWTAASP